MTATPVASMSANAEDDPHGQEIITEIIAARPRRGMAGQPGKGAARPRAQSAGGYQLSGSLYCAGIHLDLPSDGPARFRSPDDRLRAGPVAAGIQIAETLCRQLPQS